MPFQRILRWKKTIPTPGVNIIWIFHGKQNVYWLNTLNLQDRRKISHAIGFLHTILDWQVLILKGN